MFQPRRPVRSPAAGPDRAAAVRKRRPKAAPARPSPSAATVPAATTLTRSTVDVTILILAAIMLCTIPFARLAAEVETAWATVMPWA